MYSFRTQLSNLKVPSCPLYLQWHKHLFMYGKARKWNKMVVKNHTKSQLWDLKDNIPENAVSIIVGWNAGCFPPKMRNNVGMPELASIQHCSEDS